MNLTNFLFINVLQSYVLGAVFVLSNTASAANLSLLSTERFLAIKTLVYFSFKIVYPRPKSV